MRIFILLIFVLLFGQLSAQKNSYPDWVYMKNGSLLKCKILNYLPEKDIRLEIMGGSVLVYPTNELLRIDRTGEIPNLSQNKSFHLYERDNYFSLFINFSGGYKEVPNWLGNMADVPTIGLGLKFSGGKAINRHLMLGAGIAWAYLDNYFLYSSHMPVFAEVRGDLMKKKNSLYYVLALGYDFALIKKENSWRQITMTSARGGIYFQPALGLRFKSISKSHFCIEVNYAIHTASYNYVGNNGEIIGPTNNLFIRPALSLGMLF